MLLNVLSGQHYLNKIMTKTEKKYLAAFLKELGDRYANDECNDLRLPNTPENRKLIRDCDQEECLTDLNKKENIYTCNIEILDYLTTLFIQENKIDRRELPNI